MRVIFVNLHCNLFFLKPLDFILKGRFYPTYKQAYLIDYLRKHNKKVAVYVNEKGTMAPKGLDKITKYKYGRRLEHYFVLLCNGINPFKIEFIDDYKKIKKDDVVLCNYYYPNNLLNMDKYDCYKAIFMNHFIYLRTNPDLDQYGINLLINEADMSKNDFYNKYFGNNKAETYTLPYVFQERYKYRLTYSKRKNKVMAIGSITENNNYEFVDFYKTHWLQPMRKSIYDNKEELTQFIDCYSAFVRENIDKKITNNDSYIMKYYKKIYNYFHQEDKQTKYFTFDLVDKFNQYKMFICPEEITGMPGISFVEGMACGCAYIGLEGVYEQFGMISGYHYIGYNGSMEDLKMKIIYYQLHEKELKTIAFNGYKFVRKNLNSKTVAKKFYEDLCKKVACYNNDK